MSVLMLTFIKDIIFDFSLNLCSFSLYYIIYKLHHYIEIHYTIPNTKYSITIIIPMTKTIDPITYNSLAGSEGTNLFKTNKIIPIIINAIPVSNDTISILL